METLEARDVPATGILYYVQDNNSNGLFTLDPATGASTLIGASGTVGSTDGLTETNDADVLYGSRFFPLLRINVDGSGATQIGSTGYEGLAFDPNTGVLYGALNGGFGVVDQTTGNSAFALAKSPEDVEGLTYGGPDTLLGLVSSTGPNNGRLYKYTISTNTWSAVGDTGVNFLGAGLAYDPFQNVLYAKGSQDQNLYRVDPATAATTVIGSTGLPRGGGLAFVAFPALTGNVYVDANANGVRDVGEVGLPGVAVTLDRNADGTVDAMTTTDASGDYSFPDVKPGDTYRVRLGGTVSQSSPDPADETIRNGIAVTGVDFGIRVPAVTGVAPAMGPQLGGTAITITGSGFTGATGVAFGGIPAASFTVNTDGSITAVSPAGRPGRVDVTVTSPAGPSATTAADRFNYVSPNQNAFPLYTTSGDAGGVTVRNPDGSTASTTPGIGGAGARAAVGDVTGDGIADTIVTTGPGVRVRVAVVDGATGKTVHTLDAFEDGFTGGAFVAAGDVDGDGFADIGVSADTTGGARVTVYSGKDGSILADFFGIDDPNFRGGARAALGDVGGDGFADLIVAAGTGGGPRIAVYDGASLRSGITPAKLVNDFYAFEQTLRDGAFVSAGDVNGDGQADLIFGGGFGGGPRVLIWNSQPFFLSGGATIDPLADFYAADPSLAEGVRVVLKDLDGDPFADLVVGVPSTSGSSVTAYLGKSIAPTGTPLVFAQFDAGVEGVFVG